MIFIGSEAARAEEEVLTKASEVFALEVVHLNSHVESVRDVQLWRLGPPVDVHGVRMRELPGAFRTVDRGYVCSVFVEPVNDLLAITVRDPNVPRSAEPKFIDGYLGRAVIAIFVDVEIG